MERDSDRWIRLAAFLAMVGAVIAFVAVFMPAFKVSGQGVNTTEKLVHDWEGKVGLATSAAMFGGGILIWLLRAPQTRLRLAALVSIAALVAVSTASYAISVFRSQTLDALATQFARLRGVPAPQVRPLLALAADKGVLKLSGKIGVPLLIGGAGLAFFAGVMVLAKTRRRASARPS